MTPIQPAPNGRRNKEKTCIIVVTMAACVLCAIFIIYKYSSNFSSLENFLIWEVLPASIPFIVCSILSIIKVRVPGDNRFIRAPTPIKFIVNGDLLPFAIILVVTSISKIGIYGLNQYLLFVGAVILMMEGIMFTIVKSEINGATLSQTDSTWSWATVYTLLFSLLLGLLVSGLSKSLC